MSDVTLPTDFNAEDYLLLNPDVRNAGIDPIDHYLHYGHKEGRAYLRAPDLRSPFLERMAALENFVFALGRMPSYTPGTLALSPAVSEPQDEQLVKRVMAAYRRAIGKFTPTDGFWDQWHYALKRPIHDALSGTDLVAATKVLRDPASTSFFWGFDAIASCPEGDTEPHELVLSRLNRQMDWRQLYAHWISDSLVSFSETIGARRAAYPEFDVDTTLADRIAPFDADAVLDEIEQELGMPVTFPNPYPNELGLVSKRGIIGFRSVQSLYQGWRIAQLARGQQNFRVIEIGAGLGRTAYFARQFGVSDYTIVDIPLTNAAQGYFLGRLLGDDNVSFGGEPLRGKLQIIPNTEVDSLDGYYDLVVNVDSWTEMPKEVAQSYWHFARRRSNAVLSINHEFNAHTVRELYRTDSAVRATRYPYPMRRGYVEECITWG